MSIQRVPSSSVTAPRRSTGPDGRTGRGDMFENPDSRLRYEAYRCDYLRYEAYSRLQATAVAFGESLPIPEIVAIGGQSDGKSSLLEAFLGFRFNVREVEMGTRRPLIVQMVHDPTALEPRCRLQDEDSEEYGNPIVPETAVAEAVMRRTEDHLRKIGGATVSSKPIVMRAEYAYCPNLTIVDTPGFILKARDGESDQTPQDILRMVKEQAAPPHRLILFLQQSSVEWASSLWLHVVQEVDPSFQRTIMVASKFDNRLKEFQERWEIDKYLSATGYLPPNVRPYFVALPKDRAITSSAEWRKQMTEVDTSIIKHMRENIQGGFDEERFGKFVGFCNLKRFLEEELARRYRDAAPATLALLQERCEGAAADLMAADARLRSAEDVASLRSSAMKHASAVSSHVGELLFGSTDPDPAVHGMTSDEERINSRIPQWPGVAHVVRPPNAGLKLFGGAAFERCLNEFQEAAHALRFPDVARDKVANLLLAYKGRNNSAGAARAAEDLARQTARNMLGPLLDTACLRLAFVLRRCTEIAAERAMQTTSEVGARDNLQPYVAFHAALRSAYNSFLSKLEEAARSLVRHHLDAATSEFAVSLLASMPDTWGAEVEVENLSADTDSIQDGKPKAAVRESQLTVPETPSPEVLAPLPNGTEAARRAAFGALPGRNVDDSPSKPRMAKTHRIHAEASSLAAGASSNPLYDGRGSYEEVCRYAERLFSRIRQAVACQAAPATLKSAFLDPVRERAALDVSLSLFAKGDADFMTMFTAAGALGALKAKRDALQKRVDGLVKCKNEFQELAKCI